MYCITILYSCSSRLQYRPFHKTMRLKHFHNLKNELTVRFHNI